MGSSASLRLSRHRAFLVVFLVLLAPCLVFAIGFYPAIMSPDSIGQWSEGLSWHFSDQQPYPFAFTLGLFGALGLGPFPYVLFQCLLTAFVAGCAFQYFANRGVTPALQVRVLVLVLAFLPIYLFAVTIWKDITYSYSLLALSLVFFDAVTKGRLTDRQWAGTMVLSGLAMALRHNGIIYVVVVPAAIYLLRLRRTREAVATLVVLAGMSVGLREAIPRLFKIDRTSRILKEIPKSAIIGVVIARHGSLGQESLATALEVAPLEVWQNHVCFNDYYLFWHPDFRRDKLSEVAFAVRWNDAFKDAAWSNPGLVLRDKACLVYSQLFWVGATYPKRFAANSLGLRREPLVAGLSTGLDALLVVSERVPFRYLYWTPALYLAVLTIGLVYSWKHQLRASATFLLLNLANVPLILAIATSAEYRYLYNCALACLLVPLVLTSEQAGRATSRA